MNRHLTTAPSRGLRALAAAAIATPFALFTADAENPVVKLDVSIGGEAAGTITIELDEEDAPVSTKNFVSYARDGYYDNTVFHRVIDGFMIQGGGFEKTADDVQEKQSRAPIQNEAKNGLKNRRGTIAMARTPDPHSASSQFFINVSDNANLDHPSFDGWGYAVFGTVTEGMEVVDKIKAQTTTIRKLVPRLPDGRLGRPTDFKDVPETDVVITKATVVGDEAAAPAEEAPEEEEEPEGGEEDDPGSAEGEG